MAKGCYTCRRRRIICDNGLPTCQKCRDAGKECLGYQKPLTWVKGGVASRGKMMGRSFDDVKEEPRRTGESSGASMQQFGGAVVIDNPHRAGPGDFQMVAVDRPSDIKSNSAIQSLSVHSMQNNITPQNVSIPGSLVDPLLKDTNELSRFYIFHFNQKTAGDLTLYPNTHNPYRGLVSLVGDSPLIASALSATGALHYALLTDGDFSPMPWSAGEPSATGTLLSPQEVKKAVTSSMSRRPSSKVYEHFLALKQRALRQLSLDIRDPVKRNDDKTAAAIMVLALMDAIESGDEAWKYHLEGAKKLLSNRKNGFEPRESREIIGWLDTLTIDGCLIIELMGSTLARPGVLSKPFYSPSMDPTALRRLETTSWVGCPAYLLEVIFFVHARFCHHEVDPTTTTNQNHHQQQQQNSTMLFSSSFLPPNSQPLQSPEALLHHIQVFDPVAWAIGLQSFLYLPDLTMRIALATAYKAAVYLYTSRVLPHPRSTTHYNTAINTTATPHSARSLGLPPDHTPTSNILIHQLTLIPPHDPHFKCLIWPTFIAGAECRDRSQRPFILDRLSALYNAIVTVNVRNAAWVLSLMWQKQDARREVRRRQSEAMNGGGGDGDAYDNGNDEGYDDDDDDDDDFDWIQELDESRIDWLFI